MTSKELYNLLESMKVEDIKKMIIASINYIVWGYGVDFKDFMKDIKKIHKELKKEKRLIMVNNSYIYEVQFYLSIMLYDRYLKDEHILLDKYKNAIRYIYNDYINYDNNKKALMESIENYIELRKDFILGNLNECIEV